MEFLYNLIIYPIELLVEVTYGIMYNLIGNCGLAIIAVSIVIQTLILPLYKKADAIQETERQRQEAMSHWVSHIKKTFKGDEQFMMLSTYYRQQNYKSWYPLKSSIAIMLQVPFFIAAYHYLSNLSALSGQSFLFIRDLSEPDSIVSISGFSVNILPIVMTLFNLVSGAIYNRGKSFRDKFQVYGLAVIFLVLLYNSPSGLVLYWTMNNFYSMLKNVFMKIVSGRVHIPKPHSKFIGYIVKKGCCESEGNSLKLYILEGLFLTLFIGGVISLNVVNASPEEFINDGYGPVQIVIHNISVFAGIFMVWGVVFVALMKPAARYIASIIFFAYAVVSCVDYMAFGTNLGTLSQYLVYDNTLYFSDIEGLINFIVLLAVLAICLWIALRHTALLKSILCVMVMVAVIMVGINGVSLNSAMSEINIVQDNNNTMEDGEKIIHLSTSGNNVIVFMLDRAISGYIPFIFEEMPEIKEAFEGFTYYPNTLSFAHATNMASPALFGGYEYIPTEMNKRADESLKDKHDEALCLLPKLFSDAGYNVTVCSPPYAGYMDTPDLSIFDGIENVRAYDLKGKYTDEALEAYSSDFNYKKIQQNNFFYYSVMKTIPVKIQPYIYLSGYYWGQLKAPISRGFLDEYTTLTHLDELTDIQNDDSNNVLIIQNSTTHSTTLLKTPEYEPAEGISVSEFLNGEIDPHTEYVDGLSMELMTQSQTAHYHVNVAALKQLANWFTYIKESGCWDNTRIIIVADHGYGLDQFDYMELSNGIDVEFYNPLLLVKDFGETEYTVSNEFMTNADVPTLALDGLIDNPINPYTGNLISSDAKKNTLYVTTSNKWQTVFNSGSVFDTSDGEWYIVGDNIFDVNNWTKVEDTE